MLDQKRNKPSLPMFQFSAATAICAPKVLMMKHIIIC
uniref:Uncharacterized protein n=1 Tax=Arundo donax TaxID=35708 RepID=A0A0A9D1H8_ARUDO